MRRPLRFAILFLVAAVAVVGIGWAIGFAPPVAGKALSRRDVLIGLLTLGALTFAASGFDVRDWF